MRLLYPNLTGLSMSREAGQRWYNKNKEKLASRRAERGKLGLCKYCAKKALKGRSGCRKCLNRFSSNRRKYWKLKQDTKQDRRLELIKLSSGECSDCGYSENPAAFEFDHVRGKKKAAISNMLNVLNSWETILQELEKCELVCANCHRIRTHNRRRRIAPIY